MKLARWLLLWLAIAMTDAMAASYVSIATGGWTTTSTWAILRTGTITSSTASTTVTGVGTSFNTQLAAGNLLYTAAGAAIGTVKSITNATTLILTANAASSNAGINYYSTTSTAPSSTADDATINAAHTVTISSNVTNGAVTIGGTLSLTAGTPTFGGLVTINGTWSNSNRSVNLRGGLRNNGTFTDGTGTYTFQTNNQTIDGGNAITFNGSVAIANNITVTNQNTSTVRIVGNLTGGNGSSTWINDAGNALPWCGCAGVSTLQVEGTALTTGTLTASSSAVISGNTVGNTVNYAGTAASQAVKLPSGNTYYNLILSGGTSKTMPGTAMSINGSFTMSGAGTTATAGQALTIAGNVTIGTGSTFNGSLFTHSVGGDWTTSGTFTPTTSTINFNGTSAQTLTGSTTFFNLTLNNSTGLALAASTNVTIGTTGTLTLTNGAITSGANSVVTLRACNAPSVTRTNGWVNGNLQKNIPTGSNVTCTFEIGDANNYAPVILTFASVTTAGNLVGVTAGLDHPQLASSGIDATNDVKRYWTFTNSGVVFSAAGYSANFNFCAAATTPPPALCGTSDVANAGAVPGYTVEQWDGSSWFPEVVAASCAAVDGSHLCKTINSETAFGDFAIGGAQAGVNLIPGPFNVFETTASTTQILGRVFTKLSGTSFSLSVVAITTSNFTRNTAFANTANMTVEVINSGGTPGTFSSATNCWSGWSSVQSQTVAIGGVNPNWSSGRLNVTVNAPTQAVRDARIRVTQSGVVACSTDRFSVRPAAFAISSSAGNNSSSGTPTIKTGANFTITAQPVRSDGPNITLGYDGTPSLDNTKVTGSPNAGTLNGSFSAATGGAASGAAFYYSEVGNFGLNANGIFDPSFTSVDQGTDCNTNSTSNTADGAGKYGCTIGQAAIAQTTGSSGFGRFIPDNFAVSLSTPQFGTTCGTFSYVGQALGYATKPVITVTARNGTTNGLTNATTLNYAGAYMKFVNTSGQSLNQAPYDTQGGRYARFDALGGGATPALDTSALPATTADPTIGTFTNGVGTLTFSNGGETLVFTRSATTPSAAFSADIALAINVVDSDAIAYAGNPATFGAASAGNGMAFSAGKEMRWGIVRLQDVFGPLSGNSSGVAPVAIEAQYWNGSTFITNTADSCTSFTEKNFVLYGHNGSITATNLPTPTAGSNGKVSMSIATLSAGRGRVNVISTSSPPAPINTITQPGSAHICLDLDSSTTQIDNSCVAVTPANKAYLLGRWTGANYDKDPNANVGFGLYGAQPQNFIFFRENY